MTAVLPKAETTPGAVLAPRRLWPVAAACGLCGIAAWVLWIWLLRGDPGQDWMVFYTAARAWFDGSLPLLFDGEALTAALNTRFAAWLALPLNLHPWVYPPSFLLLFLPFGALPPVLSLAAFLLSGFAAALAAGIAFIGRTRWLVVASLVLCPAVPMNVMTGQNGFFSAALLVGGFALLGRSPVLGGVLLGLLTYKPQLWLMVPVALLAARQWRALAGAAAGALALALASLLVFGPDIWRVWIELATGADAAYRAWMTAGRLHGISVFACLSLLGAPPLLANLAQAAAVAAAAALVYAAYRRPAEPRLQLSVLLAAAILAAPHVSNSDAILLGVAAALFVGTCRAELRPSELALAAAVWIVPLVNPPSVFRAGTMTPLLLILFLAMATARLRRAPVAAA